MNPIRHFDTNGCDEGRTDSGWYLQAQFHDWTTFVVQARAAFTQEEVLRFAAEVTSTP